MDPIEPTDDLLIIDDAYIAKMRAESEEKIQKALIRQKEQDEEREKRKAQFGRKINAPVGMVDLVRKSIQTGKEFSIKDICKACDLSFDKSKDVQSIYRTMLNWRSISKNQFNDPDTTNLLKRYDTKESKWDVFIDMMNRDDVFVLFSTCGRSATYYQPSWVEKEMNDYDRMMRQFNGHITILTEMDQYGEDFPDSTGMLIQPGELIIEMKATLHRRLLEIDAKVEDKIKELAPPEE